MAAKTPWSIRANDRRRPGAVSPAPGAGAQRDLAPVTIGATKPFRCKGCKAVAARVTLDDRLLILGDVVVPVSVKFIHAACGTKNGWHPAE